MKAAYLAPEGTYTHNAARERFPNANLIGFGLEEYVIKAVENMEVDFGVVPWENIVSGENQDTLYFFFKCKQIKIVGEIYSSIVHCFGALPNHIDIKVVLSKDHALKQCEEYLLKKYPDAKRQNTSSTSQAAEDVKEGYMLDAGVIASEEALRRSGLEIIARDLFPDNRTRFMVLGREKNKPTGNDKTFLVIHPLVDESGVLHDITGCFAGNGINLGYIQSFSDQNKGRFFALEFKGHENDKNVKTALSEIKEFRPKILGSYRDSGWNDYSKK